MANITMVSDITDLKIHVGIVDYVFVGTVEKIEHNVIPANIKQHLDLYIEYKKTVEENLKGNLVSEISCRKMGGFKKDGTMLLISAEVPGGRIILDNGLSETEKNTYFLHMLNLMAV